MDNMEVTMKALRLTITLKCLNMIYKTKEEFLMMINLHNVKPLLNVKTQTFNGKK